jgi:hypothetical protein
VSSYEIVEISLYQIMRGGPDEIEAVDLKQLVEESSRVSEQELDSFIDGVPRIKHASRK